MTNSVYVHKLDNQTLKLVKEAKTYIFPVETKLQVRTVTSITMLVVFPSGSLPEPPLNTYPPLPEGDPETWGEDSDSQTHLRFPLLPNEDLGDWQAKGTHFPIPPQLHQLYLVLPMH